ncbi:MAG: hypothetical protein U5L02_16430 [Rheinheimera sp.]|nr:hypothetical protein [Rheinheimera sp.]
MVDKIQKEEVQLDIELDTDKATALQNTTALLNQQTDDRDLANQILGQVQMANALAKFADVVSLTKLQYIKETKLYRALRGKKGVTPDGVKIADVGTFDGFCQALGLSRTKVDEDLMNLRIFGESALNNLTAMSIGYREMRQYRKLPADQQQALIEVAKDGDKEAFVELAEEIISKHSFEKRQLITDLDETKADYEAQGELLSKTRTELDRTKLDLEKARRRIELQTPDEAEQQLRTEASATVVELDSLIKTKLQAAAAALVEHGEKTVTDQRSYLANMVTYIERQLALFKEQYALDDVYTGAEPDWMSPEALADAEALVAMQKAQREQ